MLVNAAIRPIGASFCTLCSFTALQATNHAPLLTSTGDVRILVPCILHARPEEQQRLCSSHPRFKSKINSQFSCLSTGLWRPLPGQNSDDHCPSELAVWSVSSYSHKIQSLLLRAWWIFVLRPSTRLRFGRELCFDTISPSIELPRAPGEGQFSHGTSMRGYSDNFGVDVCLSLQRTHVYCTWEQ